LNDQTDGLQPKIPDIKVGEPWGRWAQKVTRVERFTPSDGDRKPTWWVGPMKNHNQGAISHLGYSVYFELEDEGLTDEQRNRRSADDLISKLEASGVTAEMIYDSYGLEAHTKEGN